MSTSQGSRRPVVRNAADRRQLVRSEPGRKQSQKISEGIPKIIHSVYKSKPEAGKWPIKIWEDCYTKWRRLFKEPEFTYMFWDDDKASQLMNSQCGDFKVAYAEAKHDIIRSDLVRLCILYTYGGIYADLDYEPRQNFHKDLQPSKANIVQSPHGVEEVQNSLMASPSGHPFWLKAMQIATDEKHRHSDDPVFAAGPAMFTDANVSTDPQVHILPCNDFFRYVHRSDISRKKHCKPLLQTDSVDPQIKGIHWGTWLWMKGDGNNDANDLYPKFHMETTRLFKAFHANEQGRAKARERALARLQGRGKGRGKGKGKVEQV